MNSRGKPLSLGISFYRNNDRLYSPQPNQLKPSRRCSYVTATHKHWKLGQPCKKNRRTNLGHWSLISPSTKPSHVELHKPQREKDKRRSEVLSLGRIGSLESREAGREKEREAERDREFVAVAFQLIWNSRLPRHGAEVVARESERWVARVRG